ncbi:MAG: hypothetical protein AAB582_03175 [Patescibacteria group bacterium]
MSTDIVIPIETLFRDRSQGRELLEKDAAMIQGYARACLARGDYLGGEALRLLATQYERAARPRRQHRPGPLS